MAEKHVTIKFRPSGIEISKPAGINLLEAAIEAGIEVDAVCGGQGNCGKCKGRVVEGSLSTPTGAEKELLSREELDAGNILLCQRKALSDAVIENRAGEAARPYYQPDKGAFANREFELDPAVNKYYHQLKVPAIDDNIADLDRILNCFPGELKVELGILDKIPGLMREAGYQVTSVVYNNELIGVEKKDTTRELYGIAVDIGTTSIAGYILDMAGGGIVASTSATNRQRIYGADVISRISHAVESSRGLADLQKQVVKTIDEVIFKLLEEAGVTRERVYVFTLLGNTVMSHLLLGVSPVGLPSSPFVPAFARSIRGTARDLGLSSLPGQARFFMLPNIAGYVGSDTVGVILATGMHELPGNWLAIDVGTNGEIILASGGRLFTCSTAAGPAFEGGSISQGMRAEPGAICKVEIGDDVSIEVAGDIEPVGICGSGLIDAVSEMAKIGILRGNGRMIPPSQCPPGVPEAVKNRIKSTEKGYKFVLAGGPNEVALTQKDISELMLGKGAVRAGIDILMEELNLQTGDMDGIFLAGAFGNNIDPESVKGIGMLPGIETGLIKPVGNAAGRGAIMTLLSKKYMELVTKLPHQVQHVELTLHEGFKRKFAQAIKFPR